MTTPQLRLGIIGLGRAFMLMLPTLAQDRRVVLCGAHDPRAAAREQFTRDFGAKAYATADELCAAPDIDALYIASPHQFHVAHVALAAAHGKHILVEKPMALNLADCDAMIAAAQAARVHLIVGHCHSFDAPYLRTRALIESGAYGAVRMIQALNYTDFLYRPRRPEELDTDQGGGAVFSQAPHQIDVARLLAGQPVKSVRAATGIWDKTRPTEGAYTAFVAFDGGVHASLTYSGYGHFDSDELMGWAGELGAVRDAAQYGAARAKLRSVKTPQEEAALKNTRTYGTAPFDAKAPAASYNHFGMVITSCEGADLRPMADGVWIYANDKKIFEPLPPPPTPRGEVIDELYAAAILGHPPLHDGAWGRDTLAACLALLRSAREEREIAL